MESKKPLFRDLNADDQDSEITEIDSLCMNCHATGITRLLLTKIPFYKEVVLMSFTCGSCGYENNEIQSGAEISEKGVRITLKVRDSPDLNRQVVKSDYVSIRIPELEFEIPPKSQKGEVTTIEGVINRSIAGLEQDQPVRRIEHPESASKIDEFIVKLQNLKNLKSPFTIILEDISGNSFIENPNAPSADPSCSTQYFTRSVEQNQELGLYTNEEPEEKSILHPTSSSEFSLKDLEGEVLQFPTNCASCGSPCTTNMKMTNIPYFKEVVIMATTCDICGHRTNEVKSGGGIEPKGVHIEVKVKNRNDFSRDVLKSETCNLAILELELEVGPHALGGRFTTVEGLLVAVKEQLSDSKSSHMFVGDSQSEESQKKLGDFFRKFNDILEGNLNVTLVLDDPAGNSYIQSMCDDDQLDDNLKITHYDRTYEQNEDLGLNDLKTENYQDEN